MSASDEKSGKIAADRALLRQMIKRTGESASSLSLRIGRSKDYLRDYLTGRKDSITSADWKQIEQLGAENVQAQIAETKPAPEPLFLLERNLKVFAAAEGGTGEMIVSSEPIDFVPRPWYIQHVKEAYAVIVVGTSMEPAFEVGDMAIVNPKLPPVRGKDAIFVASKDGGDWRATIKRLVRTTDKEFVVAQFNPPKELKLQRSEWQQAFRVVGKYTG